MRILTVHIIPLDLLHSPILPDTLNKDLKLRSVESCNDSPMSIYFLFGSLKKEVRSAPEDIIRCIGIRDEIKAIPFFNFHPPPPRTVQLPLTGSPREYHCQSDHDPLKPEPDLFIIDSIYRESKRKFSDVLLHATTLFPPYHRDGFRPEQRCCPRRWHSCYCSRR